MKWFKKNCLMMLAYSLELPFYFHDCLKISLSDFDFTVIIVIVISVPHVTNQRTSGVYSRCQTSCYDELSRCTSGSYEESVCAYIEENCVPTCLYFYQQVSI